MVAPLLEVLLLRVLQRRSSGVPAPRPTRLTSPARTVDSLGYVAERTSVLLQRPGSGPEVLAPGSLVLPPLLGGTAPAYVVLTHEPVDVWLRIGPFETLEGRTVQQVELRLRLTLTDSPSGLRDLADAYGRDLDRAPGPDDQPERPDLGDLDGVGGRLLDRLTHEVAARTADAVGRRTLADLTGLSLGVLLDAVLPGRFLNGLLSRTALEVVDVDWPTEGRGWPRALAPVPGAGDDPRSAPR